MLANRISYWLGVTGPSYTLDSACSSSLIALEHAFRCLQDGLCDDAIVGGSNLCLHPFVSLQFSRLGMTSLSLIILLHESVKKNKTSRFLFAVKIYCKKILVRKKIILIITLIILIIIILIILIK